MSRLGSLFITTVRYDGLITVRTPDIDGEQSRNPNLHSWIGSNQGPGSNVLNALETLSPARDPDGSSCSVVVVQPQGDEGFNKPICVIQGWGGTDFVNVFEVAPFVVLCLI